MNEKLQYASMLEIPVNTCNITLSPIKKRKFKRKKKEDAEVVKNKLIEKVNTEIMPEQSVGYVESQEQEIQKEYDDSTLEQEVYDKECQEKQVKPKTWGLPQQIFCIGPGWSKKSKLSRNRGVYHNNFSS